MKYYLKSETIIVDGKEFTQEIKKTFKQEKSKKPVDIFVEEKCYIPDWLITCDLKDVQQNPDRSIVINNKIDSFLSKIFVFTPAGIVSEDPIMPEVEVLVPEIEFGHYNSGVTKLRNIDIFRNYVKKDLGKDYSVAFDTKNQTYQIKCGESLIFELKFGYNKITYWDFAVFGEKHPFKKERFLRYVAFSFEHHTLTKGVKANPNAIFG